MKIFVMSLLGVFSLFAQPIIEVERPQSFLCERSEGIPCSPVSELLFTDNQSCACVKKNVLMHPRKCSIGPMRCDVTKGLHYSWFYRYERERKIPIGCACALEK